MQRRRKRYLLLLACLLLLAAIGYCSFQSGILRPKPRPNIVFILLDDLDSVISGPYLERVIPSLTTLRKNGIDFPNTFATTSVCCPSRATILTGKLAHNTGVYSNSGAQGGVEAFRRNGNEAKTIAVYLQEAGYHTAAFGKYLNYYGSHENIKNITIPQGWEFWSVFTDDSPYYSGYNYKMITTRHSKEPQLEHFGNKPTDYSTDVLKRQIIDYLNQLDDKRPFFLYVAPTAPHAPLPAAPRHEALLQQWEHNFPRLRPNYFWDSHPDAAGKPTWLRMNWDMLQKAQYTRTNASAWVQRMGSLYAVNDMIQSVVRTLKAKGVWDQTLLVVTSDNGFMLGSHSLPGKRLPYEESIRVPLVIGGGLDLSLRRGVVESHYVLNSDFAPTFLDLADVPVPDEMDGMSFKSLLYPGTDPIRWRQNFLLEFSIQHTPSDASYEVRMDDDLFTLLSEKTFASGSALSIPSYRAIRGWVDGVDNEDTARREVLYVEWYAGTRLPPPSADATDFELYDMQNDPHQLHNLLYDDPARYEPMRQVLHQRILDLSACAGRVCNEPLEPLPAPSETTDSR